VKVIGGATHSQEDDVESNQGFLKNGKGGLCAVPFRRAADNGVCAWWSAPQTPRNGCADHIHF